MDHFFDAIEHINTNTACDWLAQMIGFPPPVEAHMLMEWCDWYSIPVYVNCAGLEGVIAPLNEGRFVMQQVIGIGLCQVDSPVIAYDAFKSRNEGFSVTGMAVVLSKEGSACSHAHSWVLTNQEGRPFLFRPDDIKKLASLLQPGRNAESSQVNHQPAKEITSKVSILEQRLVHIRKWFSEQQEYQVDHLLKSTRGNPGARDACWQWLEQRKLTSQGQLFSGALQGATKKTKAFVNAWAKFLKEVDIPDQETRPKN